MGFQFHAFFILLTRRRSELSRQQLFTMKKIFYFLTIFAALSLAACGEDSIANELPDGDKTETPDNGGKDDDKNDDENQGNGGTEWTDEDFARDIEELFPDPIFRIYVLENFDTDNDGRISKDEAMQVTKVIVYTNHLDPDDKKVNSLHGIEYFTNLTYLYLTNCPLFELDVTHNTALQNLNCDSNQLSELDVSKNTALRHLSCNSNNLSKLDVTHNTTLYDLKCRNNNLYELDVTHNTVLETLWCSGNNISELDMSKTNLVNSTYTIPLDCAPMPSLKKLYLKTGWEIEYIYPESDDDYIPSTTEILFKD